MVGKEKNLVLAENTLLRLVDNAPEKLIYTKVDGDKVGVCFEENGTANGECADKIKKDLKYYMQSQENTEFFNINTTKKISVFY